MSKLCAGRCGQEKSEEEFDWNRSGLSRKNKCRSCVTADARDRTAAWRKSKRPEDWQPKVKKVECSGESHACSKCGKVKEHKDFYSNKTYACGFETRCRDCLKADHEQKWSENTDGYRDNILRSRANRTPEERAAFIHGQFVYKLRRDFNITEEQYNYLLAQQMGVCALCFEPETKIHHKGGGVMRLAVDHDHRCCSQSAKSCGKCIRGLLCYSCNMMMGKIESKSALAKRFADYIDRRPLGRQNLTEKVIVRKGDGSPLDKLFQKTGVYEAPQRQCWQAGQNHLCNSKCQNEPTQEEIDDLVAQHQEQICREIEKDEEYIRRTFEGRWT